MNGRHYAVIIAEEMTEEFRSARGCCCASPHSLHSTTSQEQTRPDQHSRVGGSVFNFLPFHVLGNITSKTKQKEVVFEGKKKKCSHWPQCLSPLFHVSDFYTEAVRGHCNGKEVGAPHLPAGWMSRAAGLPAPSTESDNRQLARLSGPVAPWRMCKNVR